MAELSDAEFGAGDRITSDARRAARLLQRGFSVDWQPGDGGRYELYLHSAAMPTVDQLNGSRKHVFLLIVRNLGIAVELRRQWDVSAWVRYGPGSLVSGAWAGLHPVLSALWIQDVPIDHSYNPAEAAEEAEARVNHADRQAFDPDDAALGRQVRLMVMARLVRHENPSWLDDDEQRALAPQDQTRPVVNGPTL